MARCQGAAVESTAASTTGLGHLVPMLGEIGFGLFLHCELLCETVLTRPSDRPSKIPGSAMTRFLRCRRAAGLIGAGIP